MAKDNFFTSELAAKQKVYQSLVLKKSSLVRAMHGHEGLSSLQLCEFTNFFCFWVRVICQCG